jgi:ribosomal protein S18 acetylase RimI-like enzyme
MLQTRTPDASHAEALLTLYRRVAAVPDGLIRRPDEIDLAYARGLLETSLRRGLILTGWDDDDRLVAAIHAHAPPIAAFRHLLTDLTILVDPACQGRGHGRRLFEAFLARVRADYPHVLRVELFVREHNVRNVRFYESLGFINEGRQAGKILNASGQLETPLHMAWFRPTASDEGPR